MQPGVSPGLVINLQRLITPLGLSLLATLCSVCSRVVLGWSQLECGSSLAGSARCCVTPGALCMAGGSPVSPVGDQRSDTLLLLVPKVTCERSAGSSSS